MTNETVATPPPVPKEVQEQIDYLEKIAHVVAEEIIDVCNKHKLSPLQTLCVLDALSKTIVGHITSLAEKESVEEGIVSKVAP